MTDNIALFKRCKELAEESGKKLGNDLERQFEHFMLDNINNPPTNPPSMISYRKYDV